MTCGKGLLQLNIGLPWGHNNDIAVMNTVLLLCPHLSLAACT